jgi:hypothetical protein
MVAVPIFHGQEGQVQYKSAYFVGVGVEIVGEMIVARNLNKEGLAIYAGVNVFGGAWNVEKGFEERSVLRGLGGVLLMYSGFAQTAALQGATKGQPGTTTKPPEAQPKPPAAANAEPKPVQPSEPGKISNNPENKLVETGDPLKGGEGWRHRWYRMSDTDYEAYQTGWQQRYHELSEETREACRLGNMTGEGASQYRFQQMAEFKTQWLKNFLERRKY